MNHNKNVVVFTLVTTIILLAFSLFSAVSPNHFFGLENISIVSDVLKPKSDSVMQDTAAQSVAIVPPGGDVPAGPLPPRSLGQYKFPHLITDFNTDTAQPALAGVMHRLQAIKQSGKGRLRIAWLGDSFIEGDQLTKTVRRQLQQIFGGSGTGFVPVTSVVNDGFRTSVSQKWTGDWKEENFKTSAPAAPLFLSGRVYYAGNGAMHLKDLTLGTDSTQKLEKSLICGRTASGTATITVNGQPCQFNTPNLLNRILLDSSASHIIDITVQNDKLPIYGISMEPQNGVIVDNFSFRGISGEELGKLDSNFLKSMQAQNTYDLVILEYGVNVLYRPDNTDFSWHKRNMTRVLAKLHAAMPNTAFLVIGTSDRGFRYSDGSRSAIGIGNLVKTQAEMAFDNSMAFFNMFASMGGAGTIVRWADSTPILAGHDYVHPNPQGAELLGNMFFRDFMKDYNKAAAQEGAGNYVATAYHSVIDKASNLEWIIGDDKDYTWPEANQWAAQLTAGGGQWALPTIAQTLTLFNKNDSAGQGYVREGIAYPAHISRLFKAIGHGSWVWTSQDINASKAYTVNLNQGVRIESPKNVVTYPIRVFAVRKWDPQTH